ncbi:hypothetical protein CMUS01_15151 [Colletotrichum musicola]|uniref:Uncharacterized protein n=1 Tax=Colletotrichum musicola TaxID=2175873 RepID=A0A8H6MNE2_9PEZI|nr:hypothetical protein CMUS01_15151 [Colletotrichum musicola]
MSRCRRLELTPRPQPQTPPIPAFAPSISLKTKQASRSPGSPKWFAPGLGLDSFDGSWKSGTRPARRPPCLTRALTHRRGASHHPLVLRALGTVPPPKGRKVSEAVLVAYCRQLELALYDDAGEPIHP